MVGRLIAAIPLARVPHVDAFDVHRVLLCEMNWPLAVHDGASVGQFAATVAAVVELLQALTIFFSCPVRELHFNRRNEEPVDHRAPCDGFWFGPVPHCPDRRPGELKPGTLPFDPFPNRMADVPWFSVPFENEMN
jgi:hypothetical protein